MPRRLLSALLLLGALTASFGLSAGLTLHALADHHDHDGLRGRVGAALAHGHWHDEPAGDHDHGAEAAPSGLAARAVARAASFAALTAFEGAEASASPVVLLDDFPSLARPTESPPARPAGILLLHRLSLLRI
jgi:hypothetical protein